MNLPERIQRATQIADELNKDPMLCQEVKHLITDLTAAWLTTEGRPAHVRHTNSSGHARISRPQFDRQPHR